MSEFPIWQHRYEATRPMALEPVECQYIKDKRVTVEAGLHYIEGNDRPYFSVTCTIWEKAKSNRWMNAGGGAAHEEILKAFPMLAPVIALHLSDDDGTPMHALANARYWAGLTKYQEADAEKLANHLRISEEEAMEIINDPDPGEKLVYVVEVLRPRWLADAQNAICILDELIEAQGEEA